MADLPSLPLFVDDYEAATAHLTLEEDGVYMRLLRLSWRTPDCSIPTDPQWIARKMRCDEPTYWRVVDPILKEFFTRSKSRWFQKRLRGEHAYALTASAARIAAGKKGGAAKAAKRKAMSPSNATVLPDKNPSNALAPTPTPTLTPTLKKKEEEGREGDLDELPPPAPPPQDLPACCDLYLEVLSAVGLKRGSLPTYWMPPIAEVHVQRWRELGLTDQQIVDAAFKHRANHSEPPHGPKGLDQTMQRLAGVLHRPALVPIDGNPNLAGGKRHDRTILDRNVRSVARGLNDGTIQLETASRDPWSAVPRDDAGEG